MEEIRKLAESACLDAPVQISFSDLRVDEHGVINVYVQFKEQVNAANRGSCLLDLEDTLVSEHPMIRVWHTSLGDKNTLRNLRGITLE